MLKSLLNIPENIVISIGPTGCLNVLYNEAIKENKLGNLYTFPVSEIDMVSANHIEKLEKYIVKIISENFEKIKSIIIYLTCADLILVSNFSFLTKKIFPLLVSYLVFSFIISFISVSYHFSSHRFCIYLRFFVVSLFFFSITFYFCFLR